MVRSEIHGTAYSYIAIQAAYLATYFPRIYWNTACLRVSSGLNEDAATNYDKVAKAIGDMRNVGIDVKPLDINLSDYFFEPHEQDNSILYGLKGVNGVGGEVVQEIVQNKPYTSFQDFLNKSSANRTAILSLIKGGAFDAFGDRVETMKSYIEQISSPKKRITLQNFNGLIEHNLIPKELEFQKRVFIFNKALKKNKKSKDVFILDGNYMVFYQQYFDMDELETFNGTPCINQKVWKKLYDNVMSAAKEYIKENQEQLLKDFNKELFTEQWNKYASGNISAWEMDSLGYYYHKHELDKLNKKVYNVVSYSTLPSEPVVAKSFRRNGRNIPIFQTYKIAGTVVGKNNAKSTVNLLTTDSGVVTVKMTREHFAEFNRRITEKVNGVNKVVENGWFTKGTLLIVNGFRRGDTFVVKKYKKDNTHRLYKIKEIEHNGIAKLQYLRYGMEEE